MSIPAELQAYPYWCVWKYIERGGKKTKPPFNPNNHNNGDSSDKAAFGDFMTANMALITNQYQGLGIGIFDNIAAIDIDDCIDEQGEYTETAQDIIKIMDSYTELSPSNQGIRVLFYVSDFKYKSDMYYIMNRSKKLEIYVAGATKKYVTVTGNSINDKPISNREKELQIILDKYMQRPNNSSAARKKEIEAESSSKALNRPISDENMSNDEILAVASKQPKFAKLWRGDYSAYHSQSEADQALCNYLAFYSIKDAYKMDSLFRQSGLMRDKWDRKQSGTTYGRLTIEKAIKDCSNVYIGKKPTPNNPNKSVLPADYSDAGNAEVFAREYKGKVIYVKTVGWLLWNGFMWEEGDILVSNLALRLTQSMLTEADKIVADAKASGDKEAIATANALRKFVFNSRNNTKIKGMLELSRGLLYVEPDKLDAKAHILNTPSGMIDLRTKEILKHDPNAYCTKITLCGMSTKGYDIWDKFLNDITLNNQSLNEYLQMIFGMVLFGKVYAENIIIALGEGSNGKSTLFNTAGIILHDYSIGIDAELLTTRNRHKGAELANLKGKRLVIAAELEEGMRLSASMIKQLGSTDKIHGERKYKDPEDFTPSHTTILYTNHLPKVGSTDHGTWRRLIAIKFNAKFEGNNDIKNFADILAKQAGEAFLAWAVEGAYKAYKAGFNIIKPQCVQDSINEYKSDNDWLTQFIEECCEVDEHAGVGSKSLYDTYRAWAENLGEYKRSSSDFKREMEKRNYYLRKSMARNEWRGLCLRQETPFN